MAKEVRLKKIPLHLFIETLISIYERGAEYIDITGVPDKEQDSLVITVTSDYLAEGDESSILKEEEDRGVEDDDEEKIIIPKPNIRKGLTDDDLSSLT